MRGFGGISCNAESIGLAYSFRKCPSV